MSSGNKQTPGENQHQAALANPEGGGEVELKTGRPVNGCSILKAPERYMATFWFFKEGYKVRLTRSHKNTVKY